MTSSSLTGFVLHPASPLHDTGWGHPEHQGRLRVLASAVSRDMIALHERVVQLEPRTASPEEVLRVHSQQHLDGIREAVDRAMEEGQPVFLAGDTPVSEASWDAAMGSAGAVVAAVEAVVEGRVRNAFVAARPPGHHAGPQEAHGFCLVNNVAVAVRAIQDRGWGSRVLIVDWDVHHGDGTQEVFYSDPDVFYLSLHQADHFPGTGRAEEEGVGEGQGTTMNVPLAAGTSRDAYRERFLAALREARERFRPDFVMVSCGFDLLAGDPLGDQAVEPEDLFEYTRQLMAWAQDACGGKLVMSLEGGHDPERGGAGTVSVLRALAGLDLPKTEPAGG